MNASPSHSLATFGNASAMDCHDYLYLKGNTMPETPMNENIKITIELSPEEYEPIKKMADYLHTSAARIVEAQVQGQAKGSFLSCYAESNWLSVTEYLREVGEDSPRLKRIENYLEAALKGVNDDDCRTIDEAHCHNTHFTSLETFEAWQAWNLEKH